jgi:hypothetical protein
MGWLAGGFPWLGHTGQAVGRRSERYVRPWRGVAAYPLTLAGLGGALAVGQHRLAAAEFELRSPGGSYLSVSWRLGFCDWPPCRAAREPP